MVNCAFINEKIKTANELKSQKRYTKAKEMIESILPKIADQPAQYKNDLYREAFRNMAYILCVSGDAVAGLRYLDKSTEHSKEINIADQLHFLFYRLGIDPFLEDAQEKGRVLPCCQPILGYKMAKMLSRDSKKITGSRLLNVHRRCNLFCP